MNKATQQHNQLFPGGGYRVTTLQLAAKLFQQFAFITILSKVNLDNNIPNLLVF